MPDESREHALDPRVFELTRKRLSGEFITPSGMDFEAMRNRPNKENHNIDSGDVIEAVETMGLDGRKVALYVFTPAGSRSPLPCLRTSTAVDSWSEISASSDLLCDISPSRLESWWCFLTTAWPPRISSLQG